MGDGRWQSWDLSHALFILWLELTQGPAPELLQHQLQLTVPVAFPNIVTILPTMF